MGVVSCQGSVSRFSNQLTVLIYRSTRSSSAEAHGPHMFSCKLAGPAARAHCEYDHRTSLLPHAPVHPQRTHASARSFCLRICSKDGHFRERHLGAKVVFVTKHVLGLSGEQVLPTQRLRFRCSVASPIHYPAERSIAYLARTQSTQSEGLLLASQVQYRLHVSLFLW